MSYIASLSRLVRLHTLQQTGSIARTFCPLYRSINSEDKTLSSLDSNKLGKYWLAPYSEDKSPRYRSNVVAILFAENFTMHNFDTKMLASWLTGMAKTFGANVLAIW